MPNPPGQRGRVRTRRHARTLPGTRRLPGTLEPNDISVPGLPHGGLYHPAQDLGKRYPSPQMPGVWRSCGTILVERPRIYLSIVHFHLWPLVLSHATCMVADCLGNRWYRIPPLCGLPVSTVSSHIVARGYSASIARRSCGRLSCHRRGVSCPWPPCWALTVRPTRTRATCRRLRTTVVRAPVGVDVRPHGRDRTVDSLDCCHSSRSGRDCSCRHLVHLSLHNGNPRLARVS